MSDPHSGHDSFLDRLRRNPGILIGWRSVRHHRAPARLATGHLQKAFGFIRFKGNRALKLTRFSDTR